MFRKDSGPGRFFRQERRGARQRVQIAGGRCGGGEITLLHVIEIIEHIDFKEMSDFYRGLETRATARLFTMKEKLEERVARVRHEVLFGKRTETIVRYAGEMAADLMILSSHQVDRDHPALGLGTLSYGIASWPGARCCW